MMKIWYPERGGYVLSVPTMARVDHRAEAAA